MNASLFEGQKQNQIRTIVMNAIHSDCWLILLFVHMCVCVFCCGACASFEFSVEARRQIFGSQNIRFVYLVQSAWM